MTTPKKILVVDDSRIVLRLHAFALTEAGHACTSCAGGMEAYERCVMERFDLIVTDLNMPLLDGIDLARRVRALEGYARVPILLVTSETDAFDSALAREAGIDSVCEKPLDADALRARVASLLGGAA